MKEDYKYSGLTEKIIGCAMKVHLFLGPGFPERIYQKCLLIELNRAGLKCSSQQERSIYYYDVFVGKRRLDVLVEDKVLVELKAVSHAEKGFTSQVLNYLKIFELEVGLQLNFGSSSLQIKRFVYSRKSV